MPFVSKSEFNKLLSIIDFEEYEKELNSRCDALVRSAEEKSQSILETAEEKSKNILDVAQLEASNYKKTCEGACDKYIASVIKRCMDEKKLVHAESSRIITEAKEVAEKALKTKNEAEWKVSGLQKEYESLQSRTAMLRWELNQLESEIAASKKKKEDQSNEEVNRKNNYINSQLDKIDRMTDGIEFEEYFADLLLNYGFTNVQVTRATGDSGVDVIAKMLGVPFAFQCKRYNQSVGNKAVQEVFSGMAFYDCSVGVVVTNQSFTKSAITLANCNNVVLWGREELKQLISDGYEKREKEQEEVVISINGKKVN